MAFVVGFLLVLIGFAMIARSYSERDAAAAQGGPSLLNESSSVAPHQPVTESMDTLLLLGEDGLEFEAQLHRSSAPALEARHPLVVMERPPGPIRIAGEGYEAYTQAAVKAAVNSTIVYCFAGFSMREFAVNWVLHAQAVGVRGIVIGALDTPLADFLMQDKRVVRLLLLSVTWLLLRQLAFLALIEWRSLVLEPP